MDPRQMLLLILRELHFCLPVKPSYGFPMTSGGLGVN